MSTGTVRFHRVLRAPPERVYRAFLDADAMVKWLPPHGFTGKVHQIDAKVGGSYRMSSTNLPTGQSHPFGGEYLELVPKERIRHTDRFDDPNLPGEMRTTISLKQVFCGTELDIVQEGIPGFGEAVRIRVAWRKTNWRRRAAAWWRWWPTMPCSASSASPIRCEPRRLPPLRASAGLVSTW